MARPPQDAIDTFMSITGASEAVALQTLEEHGGDLNEAVNAHFNDGDRINTHATTVPIAHNDLMDIDDPIQVESSRPTLPLRSSARNFNAFSLLDSIAVQSLLDGGRLSSVSSGAPQVSHPREVREIPIEFKDDITQSESSGRGPTIEEVTDNLPSHGLEVHGTVIFDDDEDELPEARGHGIDGSQDDSYGRSAPFAPLVDMTDYSNDIEEEMIRAAIEASKHDVENSTTLQPIPISPSLEDAEMEHAVSLSLKTADQEKAPHESLMFTGEQSNIGGMNAEAEKVTAASGRQGPDSFNAGATSQLREKGKSFLQEEAQDVHEQPSIQHSSGRVTGNAESAESLQLIDSPPLSPQQNDIGNGSQLNGDAIHRDEWGGISSEEHDEAVMLEAAMFGGIPEPAAYHFTYPRNRGSQTDIDSSPSYHTRLPRPSSPTLTAKRLLREQQDDEYLAALQADRERELMAEQEAEAVFERKKHQEQETQRKQLEEEELERKLAAKEASLPQEPSADDERAVTLLVRMPDGSRRGRRFLKSDSLQLLFDYINIGRAVKPGTYRLVRPYPRRAFTDGESDLSLNELGLTSKQEALFMELI